MNNTMHLHFSVYLCSLYTIIPVCWAHFRLRLSVCSAAVRPLWRIPPVWMLLVTLFPAITRLFYFLLNVPIDSKLQCLNVKHIQKTLVSNIRQFNFEDGERSNYGKLKVFSQWKCIPNVNAFHPCLKEVWPCCDRHRNSFKSSDIIWTLNTDLHVIS